MDEDIRNKLVKNLQETVNGIILTIYVKPDSIKEKLVLEGDELVYYTEEPPVKGRANATLIRFLSRALGISSSKIAIVYGTRSRSKRILIRDIDIDKLVDALSKHLKLR